MPIAKATRARLEGQLDALPIILGGATADLAEVHPRDGGWSAKENVAHLARHAEIFMERLERIVREERPLLGTYRAEQDPEWPSWTRLSFDEALERLRERRRRLIAWTNSLSDDQADRVGIHPVLGPMNVGRWLEFFLVHEAHHLYFVMRRLGEARRGR